MGNRLFRQEDTNRLLAETLERVRHQEDQRIKEAYERAWIVQRAREIEDDLRARIDRITKGRAL
jgi:hypothetical protein